MSGSQSSVTFIVNIWEQNTLLQVHINQSQNSLRLTYTLEFIHSYLNSSSELCQVQCLLSVSQSVIAASP